MGCKAGWLYNKTSMDFSTSVHDAICIMNFSGAYHIKNKTSVAETNIEFFWCISHHVHQLKSTYLYNIDLCVVTSLS